MAERVNRHLAWLSDFASAYHVLREKLKLGSVAVNSSTEHPFEMEGDATVFDDLRVPLESIKLGGVNDPDFKAFKDDGGGPASTGVYAFAFDDSAEEEVFFSCQIPHDYKPESTIYPHVHWTPETTGASGEFAKWGLEYTWQSIGGIFGNTTTITTDASSASTATTSGDASLTEFKHYVSSFSGITGTGQGISSMILCRLYRDAGHSDDDLTDDAFLFEFDFHYERNTLGSRSEFTK